MSALEELQALAGDLPNRTVEEWKAKGGKVVGFFCSYVPEEILYAADILPIRVRATGCRETASADVYMSGHSCSFMRSCLQFALEGRYDFLDGVVCTNSCDHVRRTYDTLREIASERFPFLEFISVPHKTTDQSIAFYRDELVTFRRKMEMFSGVTVSDERLKDAIDTYNETRRLLKELYGLRQRAAPALTGAQSISVVLAALSTRKDHFNRLLVKALKETGEAQGITDHRARLMLSGSGGCEDPRFYQVIEEVGGLIVTDSLCFGSRYFWEPVQTGGDPIDSLAASYMRRPSCASMGDKVAERSDYIEQMVRDFEVDGVIYERMRYCDLWGGQVLHLRQRMKEAGIPLLEIERDYLLGSVGQLKTRVQAFLEMIEG
jgi:bzd-type benzoyl-CoA reductase N subunit